MSSHLSRIFEDMEIKECAYSRFKDDNKEKAKHVDAPCENKRHAGSTPATSTIFKSLFYSAISLKKALSSSV